MTASSPRRSHLVERAADAARAALEAETHLHVTRPSLAPVGATPVTVEPAVRPPSRGQAIGPPARNEPAPVASHLLRSAGLIGEAGPAREEIALVREQVLRGIESTAATEGRQARLVVITSTRAGEGKSFVALNLAASIAEGAHRPVVLVDSERGPESLTARLGLHGAPGLEQLRDVACSDPGELLRCTEVPGLLILPQGTALPAGAQSNSMGTALLRLAERLPDHVFVIDTPACLESSVAGLLAAAAGQITMVVEAERTTRPEVEAALDILDACPTLQLLLNRSALRVSDRFRGPSARPGDAAVDAQA